MTGFGTIPHVSMPFGIDDANMIVPLGSSIGGGNLPLTQGINPEHSAPGGNPITRHHMNGIGFLATIGGFLQQAGYQPSFDTPPTGGWPKNAIVTDVSGGDVREYLNTQDNNDSPFIGTGGLNPETSFEEDEGWIPIWSARRFNFFPNYDDREIVFRKTFSPGESNFYQKVASSTMGWFLVSRTLDHYDDMTEEQKMNLVGWTNYNLGIHLQGLYYDYDGGQNTINLYEGKVASRLIPCNGDIKLSQSAPSESLGDITVTVTRFGMEDI